MRIFIDADACPVKNETLKVASRYGLECILVSNGGMRPSREPLVTVVTVASGADVADDWIAERVESFDIVITSDIPLAARVLEQGGDALAPNGKPFDQASIGMALAMRELKQNLREANQTQTYNRSFTPRDASQFLQSLDRLVVTNLRREKA